VLCAFRPDYDNVTELEYLDMVLSESMRVYPPIPLHIGQFPVQSELTVGLNQSLGSVVSRSDNSCGYEASKELWINRLILVHFDMLLY